MSPLNFAREIIDRARAVARACVRKMVTTTVVKNMNWNIKIYHNIKFDSDVGNGGGFNNTELILMFK